jgi:hypothetical protein
MLVTVEPVAPEMLKVSISHKVADPFPPGSPSPLLLVVEVASACNEAVARSAAALSDPVRPWYPDSICVDEVLTEAVVKPVAEGDEPEFEQVVPPVAPTLPPFAVL